MNSHLKLVWLVTIKIMSEHQIYKEDILERVIRLEKDILKIINQLDILKQTDINLKYLIGKNGKIK